MTRHEAEESKAMIVEMGSWERGTYTVKDLSAALDMLERAMEHLEALRRIGRATVETEDLLRVFLGEEAKDG